MTDDLDTECLEVMTKVIAYLDGVLEWYEGGPKPGEIRAKNLFVECLGLAEKLDERLQNRQQNPA